jgi:hypothetical protein
MTVSVCLESIAYLVDLRDDSVEHLTLEGAEHNARVLHIKLGEACALPYCALQMADSKAV